MKNFRDMGKGVDGRDTVKKHFKHNYVEKEEPVDIVIKCPFCHAKNVVWDTELLENEEWECSTCESTFNIQDALIKEKKDASK